MATAWSPSCCNGCHCPEPGDGKDRTYREVRVRHRAGVARVGELVGNHHEVGAGGQHGDALAHHREHRLRRFSGGHALDHVGGQLEHRRRRARLAHLYGASARRDELRLDLPPDSRGLCDQGWTFDDEDTFLGTRTAAPQEAPQSLNLWVRKGELVAQRAALLSSAALAAWTSAVNAAASVMARSLITLRSTSMPAALSPAMNRL